LTYSKAWDKDGFYQQYSNGNPNAKVSNPIDSTVTLSLTKSFNPKYKKAAFKAAF
jgi:hypothetical protein